MSNFDDQLEHLVRNALQEDIGDGDHTTLSCIPPDAMGKAVLHIKQDGILAGMEIAEKILKIKGALGQIYGLQAGWGSHAGW